MTDEAQTDAEARFFDFIDKVKAYEKAWGLKNAQGGLATWSFEETGDSVVPFWSNEDAAKLCQGENFEGYNTFIISLKDLLGTYLPALDKQGINVGINYSILMTGIDMPAGAFKEKLSG